MGVGSGSGSGGDNNIPQSYSQIQLFKLSNSNSNSHSFNISHKSTLNTYSNIIPNQLNTIIPIPIIGIAVIVGIVGVGVFGAP